MTVKTVGTVRILARMRVANNARIARQRKQYEQGGQAVDIISMDTPLLKISFGERINLWKHLPAFIQSFAADVLFAVECYTRKPITTVLVHDSQALIPGYLLAKIKRASLIWDAVEFPPARPSHKDSRLRAAIDRAIVRRCNSVLTVGTGVQRLIHEHYRVESTVVYNIPDVANVEPVHIADIVYIGGITTNRGLEQLIQAASMVHGTIAIIGPVTVSGFDDKLKAMITSPNVALYDKVDNSLALSYTAGAKCSIIPYQPVTDNIRYCCPNKLWEAIHVGTPIVAGRSLVEVAQIVTQYKAGVLCDESDPYDIARACNEVLDK